MGIQSIVLSLIGLVNLALNTMSLPCLRRGERRRWLLVFSRYQSYRIHTPLYIPLSLSLSGNRSAKMSTFSNDSSKIAASDQRSSFPHFHIIFIEFVRLSISKAIEKDLKINIEILGWTYSYANDNDRRQGRSGVVSMSIRPSSFFFFPFSTTFPSTLSSEYWLLGANGLRYRLIQMRTGFHSKLDGATVSAML